MPQPLITEISLKITYLKFRSNQFDNELTHCDGLVKKKKKKKTSVTLVNIGEGYSLLSDEI